MEPYSLTPFTGPQEGGESMAPPLPSSFVAVLSPHPPRSPLGPHTNSPRLGGRRQVGCKPSAHTLFQLRFSWPCS